MHNSRTFKSKDWSWQSQARPPNTHELTHLLGGAFMRHVRSPKEPSLLPCPQFCLQRSTTGHPTRDSKTQSIQNAHLVAGVEGRPGRTSVPARRPLTPPCIKHSKRSGQGADWARHRLQVSTSRATGAQGSVRVSGRHMAGGRPVVSKPHVSTWHQRGSMWAPDNSRHLAVLPQSLGKMALSLSLGLLKPMRPKVS